MRICLLMRERKGGRERERERDLNEEHQLVAPTEGQTHNLSMCPDLELNRQPVGVWDNTGTINWATSHGIYAFIGWFLYVDSCMLVDWLILVPGIETTTLVYEEDALTTWATWLGEKYFVLKRFYLLFIFRERGREGEKHQCVVASHMLPTGDLACNSGIMCPDWESNQRS